MSDNILIIFIKDPAPGAVKTRLASSIGNARASLLYRLFVEAILARTKGKGFKRIIFYDPPEKREKIVNWICDDNIELYAQEGDDLGKRLSNAFQATFKKGAKRVIAIGSDSPTIDRDTVLSAFGELENKQCVIGPSQDGGYYLIGLSSFYREIFQGIGWSTERVFDETLNAFKRFKLSFTVLDENFDVDRAEDLVFLKGKLQEASKTNPKGLNPLIKALSE